MITPKAIEGVQVAAADTALYTSEDVQGVRSVVKKLVFCNTSAVSVTVTVHLVPKGGATGVANAIWDAKVIQAHQTIECYEAENQALERGDILSAIASAAVSITGRGTVAVLS